MKLKISSICVVLRLAGVLEALLTLLVGFLAVFILENILLLIMMIKMSLVFLVAFVLY
jgi:hypothetical protein